MQQAPFRQRIDQASVTAEGQVVTFDVPRQLDIETLWLVLTGTINTTVAWATVKTQTLWGLIRRVEFILNGQTVVEMAGGYELAAICLGLGRNLPRTSADNISTPVVGVAATAFNVALPIDRAMLDMVRPKDTNLATRDLSTCQIRVTIGQFSDVFTGAGTSAFVTTTLRLSAESLQEYPDKAGQITVPPYLLKRVQQDVPIVASNTNLMVKLPIGNIMRRVNFFQRTSGDLTAALINSVQLVRGSDIRYNRQAAEMAADMATLAGGNRFTGHTCADFARRGSRLGKVNDCWPLSGAADTYAILDVTTSGASPTISIVTEELIPRVKRAA